MKNKIASLFLAFALFFGCGFMAADVRAADEPEETKTVTLGELEFQDEFYLGEFEQDNVRFNGPEALEWVVLKQVDGKTLVTTKYNIDSRHASEEKGAVTWENCTLRTWMNDEFYNSAFSDEEKAAILEETIDNSDDNFWTNADSGEGTTDRVFAISYAEYIDILEETLCDFRFFAAKPTKYCHAAGADTGAFETSIYWMRTSGKDERNFMVMDREGFARFIGWDAGHGHVCVRPCMWLDSSAQVEVAP